MFYGSMSKIEMFRFLSRLQKAHVLTMDLFSVRKLYRKNSPTFYRTKNCQIRTKKVL